MSTEIDSTAVLSVPQQEAKPLRIIDFFGYLIGNRESIERVLTCPQALYFGAVLVATVAVVREYDTTLILYNPAELLKPFIASALLCFIIYIAYRVFLALLRRPRDSGTFGGAFPKFLTGYWWTAPIAWLYAVPVEILTDENSAVQLNLWALSIVSIWRVLLFSRVAGILFEIPYWLSLLWGLVPCMAAAFFGSIATNLNTVGVMGGIQLSASQKLVASYTQFVAQFTLYAFVPTVILAFFVASVPIKRSNQMIDSLEDRKTPFSASLWVIPLTVFLALGAGCCYFQPKLLNAFRTEELVHSGAIKDAIQMMESMGRDSYLPHWKLPKRQYWEVKGYRKMVLDAIEETQPENWVSELFLKSTSDPRENYP